jgi:ADP-ribose pyrophosphatase
MSASTPTPWRLLHSELAFEHRWYRLRRDTVELPGGRVLDDYFVAERSDVALVVAVTADDDVLLARQYKHGIGEITLELPGGAIDHGETPGEAAERELREELGYACESLQPLGSLMHAPSNATNRIHGFLGRAARRVGEPRLDPSEVIALEKVPLSRVERMIREGGIVASDTVAFLLIALAR